MEVDHGLLLERSTEQLIESLLEPSVERPQDIFDTDPHPSALTLALFAREVYTEKNSGESDGDYGNRLLLPEGWRLLVTGSKETWYFGVAFVHTQLQQVVVAHRGGMPAFGSMLSIGTTTLSNKFGNSLNSAVTFVDIIREIINCMNFKHGRSYNLTITGHSLGGWLAQVTAFSVKYMKVSKGAVGPNTSGGVHAKTVVFDSPGAKDMLSKIQNNYFNTCGNNMLNRLDITIYVMAPNRVNTSGWIEKHHLYSIATHRISNFVEAFQISSPNISKVLTWPKGSDEYNSFSKNKTFDEVINCRELLEDKVVPLEPHPGDKITEITYLNVFSDDEVRILNHLLIIQTLTDISVLNNFFFQNDIYFNNPKIFPEFKINQINGTLICESKQQIEVLTRRVKQLMRWVGPQFSEAVEEQVAAIHRSVEKLYHDEGQRYLESLPQSSHLIGKELNDDDIITKHLESSKKIHGELSLKIFFRDFFVKNLKPITDQALVNLNTIGIILSKGNGDFQFTQWSHAEYICAKTIVQYLNQPELMNELIKDIFLPEILLKPDNKTIRLFLNDELKEAEMSGDILTFIAEHICQLWSDNNALFRNEKHQTAIHIAVQERNEHIISLLLSGLSIERTQEVFISFITQYDINNDTALHIMDKIEDHKMRNRIINVFLQHIETCSYETKEKILFAYLFNRDISESYVSEYLLKSSNLSSATSTELKIVVTRVKEVETEIIPFREALQRDNVENVKKILELKNSSERYCLLLMKHDGNMTALHLAAQLGHPGIIRLLEEYNLFTIMMTRLDDNKKTPLHLAAECGHLDIVNLLVERGADINTRDEEGKTALMFATVNNNLPVVQFLTKSGADVNSINNNGKTALHIAAGSDNLSMVEYLFDTGADINCKDNGGNTALDVATVNSNLPVVQFLTKIGADVNSINNNSKTALHIAAGNDNLSMVEYLIESGAAINSIDNDGRTALHIAAVNDNLSIVECLIIHGAEINHKDNGGRTALDVAAANDNLPVVEILTKSDGDVNSIDNDGRTALHIAAGRGNHQVVENLVQQRADLDRTDREGMTALTCASRQMNWEVVGFLLEKGADINADGGRALRWAIWGEKWFIVKSFIEKGAPVYESAIPHNYLSVFKENFPEYRFKK